MNKTKTKNKTALVCGAGGFIGSHLVRRLKSEGLWVRGVDLNYPKYSKTSADEFMIANLTDPNECKKVVDRSFDEVYQLAANMGGAGFIFTGNNDADIIRNSSLININILDACRKSNSRRIFYSSSACVYSELNQSKTDCPDLEEKTADPAQPDSDYGWEKLFSERLYQSYSRNYSMEVRIGRYHNVFGIDGSWDDGREKVPAALCRKIAMADEEIEIWGDGEQTRSFLYIDECLEGTIRLMRSNCIEPVNIGSDKRMSINELAYLIMDISEKKLKINNIDGPIGVRGRGSNNDLIFKRLGWKPSGVLKDGLKTTYKWISKQIEIG
jgi:nucleoside-diphosphate-sugar epimerase